MCQVSTLIRRRDLSCSGSGTETHSRVRLPSGEIGWGSEIATDLCGRWPVLSDTSSAARHAEQYGLLPLGSVVLRYTREVKGFRRIGRALARAEFLTLKGPVALRVRRTENSVFVTLPDDSVVEFD